MADQDRYERRRQEHSSAYPYDDGWAVWDLIERRQVGYFANLERAKADVKERNKSAVGGGQSAAKISTGLFGGAHGR